ncbi:MAG: ribonuclease HII [Candidatus Peribacteraceae bacterium]|nr:ribonuclease HII [Candidatus Peribacteraceae bacterium]MDD5742457.1 ribonuclease HII [Candidatus Peribacteraceae bacterium]
MSNKRESTAVIAGIDEAGRGALAGPVVAGACILPNQTPLPPFIRDSKKLTPDMRDEAFAWITTHCAFGTGIVEAAFIDRYGILPATEKAMQEAVGMLAKILCPTYLLVDGRDKFWFDYPHTAIIDGDNLEPCISAASIMAKVTRDRLMVKQEAHFPGYGFAAHKGYGTAAHFAALRSSGPSAIHRRSFLGSALET